MYWQLFFVLFFFAPAGIANMMPIFAARLPIIRRYSYPLDGYKTWRGQRILGDHKTIRGFVVGILSGIAVTALLIFWYNNSLWVRETINYDFAALNPYVFGTLSGFGALAGDSIKSFFKRQVGIPEGQAFFPFDQADYILGGIAATAFYAPLDFNTYALLFATWFPIHLLATTVGYLLKVKSNPV